MSESGLVCLLRSKQYKPGDPQPEGYLDRQDWARVQLRAGLKQRQCPVCGRWRFPQQKCCKRIMPEAGGATGNLKVAGKRWQKACPPCPRCKTKEFVTVLRDGKDLIACCSHCAIGSKLDAG